MEYWCTLFGRRYSEPFVTTAEAKPTVTQQIEQTDLTIQQAAVRLGVSSDAVRMRFKRGRIKGYKKGGRIWIVLDNSSDITEHSLDHEAPQDDGWTLAARLQTEQLERLKQDNERLNARIDQLMAIVEREQILRRQTQVQLARLLERMGAPGTETGADGNDPAGL
jgi:excisionase family DNA binding protein